MTAVDVSAVLLTAEEGSAYLGGAVSADWLVRAARRGDVSCVRIGRSPRYLQHDLDELIRRHRCDAGDYGRKPSRAAR